LRLTINESEIGTSAPSVRFGKTFFNLTSFSSVRCKVLSLFTFNPTDGSWQFFCSLYAFLACRCSVLQNQYKPNKVKETQRARLAAFSLRLLLQMFPPKISREVNAVNAAVFFYRLVVKENCQLIDH
jgi:hypothetical protein